MGNRQQKGAGTSHEVFKVLYVSTIIATVICKVIFHRCFQASTRHHPFLLLFGFILLEETHKASIRKGPKTNKLKIHPRTLPSMFNTVGVYRRLRLGVRNTHKFCISSAGCTVKKSTRCITLGWKEGVPYCPPQLLVTEHSSRECTSSCH